MAVVEDTGVRDDATRGVPSRRPTHLVAGELTQSGQLQDTGFEAQRESTSQNESESDGRMPSSLLTRIDVTQYAPSQSQHGATSSQKGEGGGEKEGDADLPNSTATTSTPLAAADATAGFARPLSRTATNIYTIAYLVFFSFWGTLARLGLHSLTFYPGAPVTTGILWANVGGCVVMGFFAEDRKIFAEEWGGRRSPAAPAAPPKPHKAVKKTIPLYIGITTGFCGSFTSFSTFMSDTFLALSNSLPTPGVPSSSAGAGTALPRNDGYSVMAFLAVILSTAALSLSALHVGAHLARAVAAYTPTLPFRAMRRVLDRLAVVLAAGCWLGAVLLAIWPPERRWRGRAVLALVFAPVGTLARFYASLALNPRAPAFPLGTFACNVLGCAVFAACYDLQHARGVATAAQC
ncbi:hypothetical protein KEM52_001978 [Ascosphaera acerosa]|nr:hypothetical protein KEM52_001978 [Ascosphaera acerosa]